jgi:RimJ/RimL family protein N-acetyltransferase
VNALQLMRLQVPALYVLDQDGRLRYIGEPGYAEDELDPAPRFFMGRTAEGNVWAFRHDLPDGVVRELEELCALEAPLTVKTPPKQSVHIKAVLKAHQPITAEERGPAYWLPGEAEAGPAVLITEANADLLEAHFPWRRTSRAGFAHGPVVAALEDGVAVSLCFCSRFTPQAAEAGIETLEAARGRGHATAAAALWAKAVRQTGRLALYSTSWGNLASQGVARRLGAVLYGEDWWVG